MTINNLGQKVLNKIKSNHLSPKPRWQFLLKDWLIWLISFICLIIGSLAWAVIIYMIRNNDWDVYQSINDNLLAFVLITLPYIWLVLLIIFIALTYYNVKHTKKGYKLRLPFLVIITIIISIFVGTAMYHLGIGRAIDRVLAERMPGFHRFVNPRHRLWAEPGEGRLAGHIIYINHKNDFQILDMAGQTWRVDASEAKVMPEVIIQVNQQIRMLGEKLDDNNFKAMMILSRPPMMPPPPMFKKGQFPLDHDFPMGDKPPRFERRPFQLRTKR